MTIFLEHHTSAYLKEILTSVIDEWKVNDKVICITSDGAANILRALTDAKADGVIGDSHRCVCHTLHLTVTGSIVKSGLDDVIKDVKKICTSFRSSNVWAEQLKRSQLVQNDGAGEAIEHVDVIVEHEVPQAEDEKYRGQPLKLKQDVCTRWSSTFYMLERALKLKANIKDCLDVLDAGDRFPSAETWRVIEKVVALLKPFESAVRRLEGEKYSTLSLCWPIIAVLKTIVCHPYWQETWQVGELARALEEDLEKRFHEPTPLMRMASFLDPRHKGLSFADDLNRGKCMQDILEYGERVLLPVDVAVPQALTPPVHVAAPQPVFDLNSMLQQQRAAINDVSPLAKDISEYLSFPEALEDTNPLIWWKANEGSLPVLSKLARRLLILPASSAPSERVFSKVNEVVDKKRNRLAPSTTEQLIFLESAIPLLESQVLQDVHVVE